MRLLGDLTEVADRMLCWRGACRQFEWGEGSLVRSLRWAWRGSCCHNTTRTRRNERSQSHQRPVTNRSQRPCSLSLHHRLSQCSSPRVVDPRWRAHPGRGTSGLAVRRRAWCLRGCSTGTASASSACRRHTAGVARRRARTRFVRLLQRSPQPSRTRANVRSGALGQLLRQPKLAGKDFFPDLSPFGCFLRRDFLSLKRSALIPRGHHPEEARTLPGEDFVPDPSPFGCFLRLEHRLLGRKRWDEDIFSALSRHHPDEARTLACKDVVLEHLLIRCSPGPAFLSRRLFCEARGLVHRPEEARAFTCQDVLLRNTTRRKWNS